MPDADLVPLVRRFVLLRSSSVTGSGKLVTVSSYIYMYILRLNFALSLSLRARIILTDTILYVYNTYYNNIL